MPRPFIVGNWKMNLSLQEARILATALRKRLVGVEGVDVGVCPAFVFLMEICSILKGSGIFVGAQNMHWERKGAFTGEVSGEMLKEIGCTHVILGHSERRHVFGEIDQVINAKLRLAFALGLRPIFCLGEKPEERESGRTFQVVDRQLKAGLEGLEIEEVSLLTIAYEPVWAIGTGKNATPAQAEEVHSYIRGLLKKAYGEEVSSQVRIQYGGSVTPQNTAELLAQPEINGLLVGGASLKEETFLKIVSMAMEQLRSPI
ncbi:MAG TPA: triose-phosphate isomerase [Candidatus Hypogeohydataceae bacterium YC38]|nr:triose-phosphate isomerase [Candidatus Brocadiales bacterium]